MITLLLGTHLFFTFRLRFIQKKVFRGIKFSVSKEEGSSGDLSSFGTLATTLAATLGTGNIIGVSTAVFLGGPGAVLWCWITGILGMATTYTECYLSFLFRQKNTNGTYSGGPMYMLEYGLHKKWLGLFYALCTVCASFGVGCTTQANSITTTTSSLFGISPYIVGFFIALPVGLVIVGGIRSIGKVCTTLVPTMGLFYIIGCIIILLLNINYLSDSICLILQAAFRPKAVAGGVIGCGMQAAIRYGIARGLFTNEAGLGTAGITAAAAKTPNAHRQALISMTATFWDTVVMCAITGLVIVTNLLKYPDSINGFSSAELTTAAFLQIPYGDLILGVAIMAFATATLIGWSYFGEKAFAYLFGTTKIKYYQFIYIIMIYIGAVMSLDLVWELTDLINAFMAVPCLFAILKLSGYVKKR